MIVFIIILKLDLWLYKYSLKSVLDAGMIYIACTHFLILDFTQYTIHCEMGFNPISNLKSYQ